MSDYFSYVPPPKGNYMIDDSGYMGEFSNSGPNKDIESPISISEIGQSVTEGSRFGSLIQTSQQAIKFGTSKMELALGMGGGAEPVGAENYGEDARQALREISKANQIDFVSTHSPTQVGNLSGFNQQQGSFSEQQRQEGLEEVKKAIKFAGDVAQGGAVVVHTGEFWRDMSEQKWNKNISIEETWDDLTPKQKKYAREDNFKEFLSYPSEQEEATHYLVDKRTGRLIQDVKKNVTVYEPVYKKNEKGQYIDKDDKPIASYKVFEEGVPEVDPEKGGVKVTEPFTWDHFQKMADEWNKDNPSERKTAAQMYMESRLHNQQKQSKGMAQHYGRDYSRVVDELDKAKAKKNHFEQMDESNISNEERISRITSLQNELGATNLVSQEDINEAIQNGTKPSEFIKDKIIGGLEKHRSEMEALSSHYKTSEKEVQDNIKNIQAVDDYAINKSVNSYAELGINAMEESKRASVKEPIFVAPENIFPEMGYASHPEEMIEMIKKSRERMIDMLTSKKITDPTGAIGPKGEVKEITNPHYRGISKKQAEKEAKEHIKMTFDTQHLGMWWKHFQPLPGETYDQRRERFDKWYKKMVEKMQDEEVIGHIHLVDSLGSGHHHLPAGQGNLPLYEAIEHLKSKGYKGTIISEGHGEEANFGQGRIVKETWKHFGAPLGGGYGTSAPGPSFGSIQNGYFSQVQSPYFTFGSYVPSNEWKLWSEVPFE
ncbi:MAG: TIM barrel protein [Nanobdellota archaeon]